VKEKLSEAYEYLKQVFRDCRVFFFSWIFLFKVLWNRTIEGLRNIDFVIYFVVVIIIVGMLGFSDLLYKVYVENDKSVATNLQLAKAFSIYFIAIIATSSADLILNRDPNEDEARSLRMPGLTFLILGGVLSFLIQYNLIPTWTCRLSLYGLSGALFLWWITNSTDKKYKLKKEILTVTTTIGGDDLNDHGGPNDHGDPNVNDVIM
jgi:hypothetical protein